MGFSSQFTFIHFKCIQFFIKDPGHRDKELKETRKIREGMLLKCINDFDTFYSLRELRAHFFPCRIYEANSLKEWKFILISESSPE